MVAAAEAARWSDRPDPVGTSAIGGSDDCGPRGDTPGWEEWMRNQRGGRSIAAAMRPGLTRSLSGNPARRGARRVGRRRRRDAPELQPAGDPGRTCWPGCRAPASKPRGRRATDRLGRREADRAPESDRRIRRGSAARSARPIPMRGGPRDGRSRRELPRSTARPWPRAGSPPRPRFASLANGTNASWKEMTSPTGDRKLRVSPARIHQIGRRSRSTGLGTDLPNLSRGGQNRKWVRRRGRPI